jgi:predicted ATP-dependent endonuclease of OLD family
MKIRGMEIARWRNVPDLTIEPDADTNFICLVGVNGVGKSKSAGADRLASSQLASARHRCRSGRCHSSAGSPSTIAGSPI